MSTLLLRAAAPLQAWGAESNFDIRKTYTQPSKSGVVGIVAAALGRKRCDPLDDLNALRFGVRVDQPGEVLRDFHTAHSERSAYVTNRYYLSDAVFLAGLEGDRAFLEELVFALEHPVFPLFLGRRSCPPTGRLVLGIRELPLEEALTSEPWLAAEWRRKKLDGHLRIMVDCDPAETGHARRRDLAVSFDPAYRRYAQRPVREFNVNMNRPGTEHDPMSELM